MRFKTEKKFRKLPAALPAVLPAQNRMVWRPFVFHSTLLFFQRPFVSPIDFLSKRLLLLTFGVTLKDKHESKSVQMFF